MTDPRTVIDLEILTLTEQRDAKLAEIATIDGAIQAFIYLRNMLANEALGDTPDAH